MNLERGMTGLFYCRQCTCLYQCESSKIMEEHMTQQHPGYPGSWDHFEDEANAAQERFWDAYGDRRW